MSAEGLRTIWRRELFGNKLAGVQLRHTLGIVILFGAILTFVQLALDVRRERVAMDEAGRELLQIARPPAELAAFILDRTLAAAITDSLIDIPYVLEAQISDNIGGSLATATKAPPPGRFRSITSLLFPERLRFDSLLYTPWHRGEADGVEYAEADVGLLVIVLDPGVLANNFIDRTQVLILDNLFNTLLLGLALFLVFHTLVTRPLGELSSAIESADPHHPVIAPLRRSGAHAGDELDRLRTSFADLLDRVGRAQRDHRNAETRRLSIEQRFIAAARNMPDGMLAFDGNDTIVFISERFRNHLPPAARTCLTEGRGLDDCLERSDHPVMRWLRQAHEGLGDGNEKEVRFEIEPESVPGYGLRAEAGPRVLSFRAASIAEGGGIILSRDITERMRLEAELRQAEKMRALGTFASGIAHDFNNLLATIFAAAEVTLAREPAESPARPGLERILAAARRGRSVLRQLLDFSRGEESPVLAIDTVSAVGLAVDICGPELGDGVDVALDLPDAPYFAKANESLIYQLVSNLCLNAAHAMDGHGQIRVIVSAEGESVRLVVEDSGPGIDSELRERIFEPFYTTKGVGEGSGLGLSVVHGIVKRLQGRISVGTTPAGGARFEVTLPRAQGPVTAVAPVAPEPERPGGTSIVVVDPDHGVGAAVSAVLRDAGYSVAYFDAPEDLLAGFEAKHSKGGVAVMRDHMPGLSAMDTIESLRATTPGLAVVVMSDAPASPELAAVPRTRVVGLPPARRELLSAVKDLKAGIGDDSETLSVSPPTGGAGF